MKKGQRNFKKKAPHHICHPLTDFCKKNLIFRTHFNSWKKSHFSNTFQLLKKIPFFEQISRSQSWARRSSCRWRWTSTTATSRGPACWTTSSTNDRLESWLPDFSLMQYTKRIKNIPNTYKICQIGTYIQNIPNIYKIYQIPTKYTKYLQNIPNGHKIYQTAIKYTNIDTGTVEIECREIESRLCLSW
jgi:hypothetical protein